MSETVEELFQMHADAIHSFAWYMLGSRASAEDVVQETFLRAVRALSTVRDPGNYRAWLWSIARRYISDVRRRDGRRKEHLSSELRASETANGSRNLTAIELRESLLALPRPYREVVLLRIVKDLSTEDTAIILGWSQAKVRSTLHRALKVLRLDLQESMP